MATKKSTAQDTGAELATELAKTADTGTDGASGAGLALSAEDGAAGGDVGGEDAGNTGTGTALGDDAGATDAAGSNGTSTLQAGADLAAVMQSLVAAGAAERKPLLYRVISPLNHDQVDHPIGTELELDEKTAEALLGHTVVLVG